VDFGLVRDQSGENTAQAKGVIAKRGAHPVLAGRGSVPFVEDEVDDFEDGAEARGAIGAARHFKRHAGFGERALGAHDALRDGRLGRKICARDFGGGQAAEKPKRESDASVSR
jgi:hypothetical protein